jgi:ribosome-interacting GTPase 1
VALADESKVSDLEGKIERVDRDKADESRVSDLESKVTRLSSDLDDKARTSDLDELEGRVKRLYCHFHLTTGGIFGAWPSDCN